MSTLISISPNMAISQDASWGHYNRNVVHGLLKSVDQTFAKALEQQPFSSRESFILHKNDAPMCSLVGNRHIIFLTVCDDYWCQWIYQFAHEYCHHLIDGNMSGEIKGLAWFEESICEISSMYHLHVASRLWASSEDWQIRYAQAFRDYLDGLISSRPELKYETHHPGFLSRWIPVLNEPVYHRGHYNAIATRILPLFVDNPALWKMILSFGDMTGWENLEQLFSHLKTCASDDYRKDLEKLTEILLS